MKTRFNSLFILVMVFSFVTRLLYLTQNPQGFDVTEAAFAYNAYSVLKTGHDEDGQFLPAVLISIGDYKLAGYTYWQIPFIWLFGLNEFSARFSTAFAGMISLFLIYYIVYEIFKNQKLALLTTFFTSLSPWHIVLSRMAYDPMIALMFYLASIVLFIKWSKSQKLYILFLSALALCWGLGTYYAVWVLFPFTLIFYVFYILKKSKSRKKISATITILALPLLVLAMFLVITRGERLGQDSTFQVHAQPLLDEQIREDQHGFHLLVTRLFHNKLVFYPYSLIQSLFTNLSFDFLFLNGDKFDRRFWVPYQGVLYLWTAPFLLLGILYFWKYRPAYVNMLILMGIVVVFFGSAFSEFGSESQRTLFAAPLFCFLISYGLLVVYQKLRHIFGNPIFVPVFIMAALMLSFNVAYFNHQYYWHANVHQPWGRNYGASEVLSLLKSFENKYQKIVIPDSMYIFYYFYNQIDPKIAFAESKNRLNESNFLGLKLRKQIGNYLTMPISCPKFGKLNVLYVCQGTKIPKNTQVIRTFYYRDQQPAYILLEFKEDNSTEASPFNVDYADSEAVIPQTSDRYW